MLFRCFAVLVFPLLALRACSVQVDFPVPAGDSFVSFSDVDSLDLYNTPLIQSQGGYEGVLLVGDDMNTTHGKNMYEVLRGLGIPSKNIVFYRHYSTTTLSTGLSNTAILDLFSEYSGYSSGCQVVGIPAHTPFRKGDDDLLSLIGSHNFLFVFSIGNVYPSVNVGRDFWRSDIPFWGDFLHKGYDFDWYMQLFDTGKVIVASSVAYEEVDGGIKIEPGLGVSKCGDIKDHCFSLFLTSYPSGSSSSRAATVLSAISFYLAQMYPTAEEIVSVLRSCAIDVGEPGPDEEYGVGVVNLVCPEVLSKELTVAAQSLKVSEESHALTALTHRLPESVSLFSSVGLDLHGMQGYAGVSYATQSLQAVALAGFGRSSLGIYSDLYHERSMFFELGVRKPLAPHLSLVGTYGHQYGNLSVDSVRAGLHAVKHIGRMQTSVYVGRHMFRCSLGLPGYQLAGARKVSFSRGVWEARFSLSFSL